MTNPRAGAALSRDLRDIQQGLITWVLWQRGLPEHVPGWVHEEREERERFARLMQDITEEERDD
jgi:hypothetical protein